MIEIWKLNIETNNYDISNLGRIRNIKTGQILSVNMDKHGYYVCHLSVNGKTLNRFVHRLIAQAFIPNPENKKQVNHIDGNKTNNSLENLEWTTIKENRQHAYDTGLQKGRKGTKHHNAKLTENDVKEIRKLFGIVPNKVIIEKFNISRIHMINIAKRKSWKHI